VTDWSVAVVCRAWPAWQTGHTIGRGSPAGPSRWVASGKANQALMVEWAKRYGPDPGRAAGGLARAARAQRDPWTKTFTNGRVAPHQSDSDLDEQSATAAGSVAGSPPVPVSYSNILGKAIGKHPERAREDVKIATSFTPEQLGLLDNCQGCVNEPAQALSVGPGLCQTQRDRRRQGGSVGRVGSTSRLNRRMSASRLTPLSETAVSSRDSTAV
jgi:hypothetical protein